jgi:DUF218 domain
VRRIVLVSVFVILGLMSLSGRFLVINQPERADVILVLAGETDHRPTRALELFHQGYAPQIILNVPTAAKIYKWTEPELAQAYIKDLPESSAISICPIAGQSTKEEAKDSAPCLGARNARRILLVTSDFHTRRALSIFRHELSSYDYSVAAAFDSREFGVQWWRHREWAKVNFGEWARLLWWEGVERWI